MLLLAALAATGVIGAVAAAPIRKRFGGGGEGHRLAPLLVCTGRPFVVLLISLFWYSLVRSGVVSGETQRLWLDGTRAWLVLWLILLSLGVAEGLGILAYAVRGRAFPVPPLLRNILRGVVVIAVVFGLLKYSLGVNISPLLASTALVTAVVGLALQGVLGNLMAGMSLHLVRSVVPGDWVRIDDVEGQVVEMNWRETRLRTRAGHYIILPNSRVAGAQIHNMTYPDAKRRHEMFIPLRCSVPPEEVISELTQAAAAVPGVLADPPPAAMVSAFKDYAVEYRLRFWSEQYFKRVPLEGEVARMIWYRLRRKGIEIPLPIADEWVGQLKNAWLRHEAGLQEEVKRRAEDLQRSELMSKCLVDDKGEPLVGKGDVERLAEFAKRVRFARGETLFRQGERGDACYVVVRGKLRGTVEYADVREPASFELGPGALVGEMSLLTRLPRTATVVAVEESELLEIPEVAFQHLLALRPDVPERLADIVAKRAAANADMLQRLKDLAGERVKQTIERKSILERLFGLLGRAS